MGENHSIKEYYIKLEKMMNNAVNMLTALNKALISTSSEITVDIIDINESNDTHTSLKIPSFLYIENKIEQLDNIISNLFEIPKSGEAWFHKTSDMYKLELIKSNNAPLIPKILNYDNLGFNIKENNIFKDFVIPKTYIRLNISNLPDNIDKILMKKLVIFNQSDADYLKSYSSYSDIKNALYNRSKGSDYEEYDSVLDLPIKADKYKSYFKIEQVEQLDILNYKVWLDTSTYFDKEDESIQYILKKGDFLCLSNEYVIYKIKDIKTIYNSENTELNEYIIFIEESIGHINLQTFEENSEMYLQIYNESYSEYHYIDVPLEENPNIILFISTLYNNVRSSYSDAIHLNLNNIYMKDSNDNFILDDNGNKIGYLEYYNNYCKNIGDLMVGFTQLAYPQVSNYTNNDLLRLTDSDELKQIVTDSLYANGESLLSVVRINSHLIDDETSKTIISLHAQKNDINSQLRALQDNIDQVYTQLTTTDFSQEATLTQESLRAKLNDYYTERTNLEKQLLNIVDDINLSKTSVYGIDDSKYRVRGVTDASDKNDSSMESPIISFLHNNFGFNCDVIGLEVEYKYKTATKDSTKIVNSNDILFTDWNRLNNVERERYLKFDPATNKYVIVFSNYSSLLNVIKWNQIDIPINQGEDVIVRIRYKYNIGQPFINLYSPWSNEITIEFPVEYTETTNISSILEANDNDVVNAKFIRTLINDGYEEHITNKIIDNSVIYYHMPDNIYSGFNTPENNLISLKDKLISMDNEINTYKQAIDNEVNSKYVMLLEWDNTSIELSNMTNNNVTINELINGSLDSFVKKKMNLIIKNIGSTPIKLYSIMPGNVDTPLIDFQNKYFDELIVNYDRVPMLIEGSSIPSESIVPQYMGQWIYFRQTNPYTLKSLYYDNSSQNIKDTNAILQNTKPSFTGQLSSYIGVNNQQVLLPYRNRFNNSTANETWGFLSLSSDNQSLLYSSNIQLGSTNYKNIDSLYLYDNCDNSNNEYIMKYEHLINTKRLSNNEISYLSDNISFSEFVADLSKSNINYYNGAFLIPELVNINQILCDTSESNQYKLLDVGKTLSIPLLFEYFLTPNESEVNLSIAKSLAFDIKTSLIKEPDHYILTVTAKYDYSQSVASTESYANLVDGLKNI